MKVTKFLFVEDGSVDVDEINKTVEESELPIKVIVYRQGAKIPLLVDVTAPFGEEQLYKDEYNNA